MTERRLWRGLIVVVLVALAALFPAMLNGGPFFHPDTPSYLRAAAAGAFKLFGIQSDWTQEYLQVYATAPAPVATTGSMAATGSVAATPDVPVTLSGRSIYYGFLAYLAYLTGRFWLLIALQSILAATSVYLTIRLIGRAAGVDVPERKILLVGLVTALASSLGFNSSYVMPGIFAGLGLLAEANLLFLWRWQSRWEKLFWVALMAYVMLVHTTDLILALVVIVLGLAYSFWRKIPWTASQLASIGGCIMAGALGQMAFGYAVTVSTGAAPIRPPFVAMRLIADGSGYAYLREHCATENYFYCRALREPNMTADIFLWSRDPQTALFRGLPEREQRRSAAEQGRFVAAVVADRPVQVIGEMTSNSLRQLFNLDLVEFNYTPENRDRFEETMPPDLLNSMKNSRAYNDRMPVNIFEASIYLITFASLIALIIFISSKERSLIPGHLRGYCLCILAAIVANAIICGALSGPKGRYQTRLIWVMPVVAGALISFRKRQITRSPESA